MPLEIRNAPEMTHTVTPNHLSLGGGVTISFQSFECPLPGVYRCGVGCREGDCCLAPKLPAITVTAIDPVFITIYCPIRVWLLRAFSAGADPMGGGSSQNLAIYGKANGNMYPHEQT